MPTAMRQKMNAETMSSRSVRERFSTVGGTGHWAVKVIWDQERDRTRAIMRPRNFHVARGWGDVPPASEGASCAGVR